MFPQRPFAETNSERLWYTLADLVVIVGRRLPVRQRTWYPLWCWCYRRPALPTPDGAVAAAEPALAERAVGEPLA